MRIIYIHTPYTLHCKCINTGVGKEGSWFSAQFKNVVPLPNPPIHVHGPESTFILLTMRNLYNVEEEDLSFQLIRSKIITWKTQWLGLGHTDMVWIQELLTLTWKEKKIHWTKIYVVGSWIFCQLIEDEKWPSLFWQRFHTFLWIKLEKSWNSAAECFTRQWFAFSDVFF